MFGLSETDASHTFYVPVWIAAVGVVALVAAGALAVWSTEGDGTPRPGRTPMLGVALAIGFVAVWTVAISVGSWFVYFSESDERAIDTLEERYGVTIEEFRYSERPKQWRIDGIWRECYLSDADYDHAAKAQLLCDAYDPEKPRYAELGASPSAASDEVEQSTEDPTEDPAPVIVED